MNPTPQRKHEAPHENKTSTRVSSVKGLVIRFYTFLFAVFYLFYKFQREEGKPYLKKKGKEEKGENTGPQRRLGQAASSSLIYKGRLQVFTDVGREEERGSDKPAFLCKLDWDAGGHKSGKRGYGYGASSGIFLYF